MKLIAVADLHLGFSAYPRLAPNGENQRAMDVAATFTRFVDRAIELQPDLITVAGDLFHHPRPGNRAIVHAVSEFARLTRALPDAIVVVALGNHDHSRAGGSSILPVLAVLPNIHVAWSASMRFTFPVRDVSVLVVPDVPMLGRPDLTTHPIAAYNVLVLHGEAAGVKQTGADTRCSLTEITPDELGAEAWDWVALGHYHQHEHVAPNAAYSGSIDFTSSNPWAEIHTPKGFIERDLDTGAETFHVLEPGRRFVDLEPIQAEDLGADDIDQQIANALDACAIDDAVVRLRVLGVSRDIERGLNQKALRSYQRRALNLRLDFRRPAAALAVSAAGVPLGRRKFSAVEEKVRAFLGSDARVVPADVDRDALTAKALEYIQQAAASETEQLSATPASQGEAAA